PVAPPPTQGSPFRSLSTTARNLNSSFIHTDIYLGLSQHLGLGVSACTNIHPQTPQRHNGTNVVEL
uniref:Ovule protein n=1 Tax=Mesocestoides corti TaxID=53468 RepID=A0A5K3EW83_MESCO